MRYISLFSGIEAASVAWQPLGWEAVAFAEIEPSPSAVLAHRFPDVPNLGDITKVDWSSYRGSADLVCGGSPCQSFSVAGLRKGLADPRGNLALEYLRAVDALRPEWVVWENVPGVLSADGGRAFGTFLGGLAELGYGFAYRVLDAQYVRVESHPRAVPQRRRRVFVVGCLGDWRRAAAVLLERESLRGHTPPRREAGERVAGTITSRASGGGGGPEQGDGAVDHLIPEVSNALCSNDYKASKADKGLGQPLIAHTLKAEGFDASEDGTGRGVPLVMAFAQNSRDEVRLQGGDGAVCGALAAEPGMKQTTYVQQGYAVRRLTPRECERLQGFPDDWTLVPYRGKSAADGPRYKAIGNSMAVNVMRWIGERIQAVA